MKPLPTVSEPIPCPIQQQSTITAPSNIKHLDYIDAMRGLAISGVVLVHCGQGINNLPSWLHSFADYGGRGVQLFFVLSALTLSEVYLGKTFSITTFWWRRFFRIAPMFYFGAILYSFLNGLGPQRFAPEGLNLHQFFLTGLFLNIWSLDSFNSVVPGGWSIGNEATFYILFVPLLNYLTTLRRALIGLVVASLLSKLIRVLTMHYIGHDTLFDIFVAFSFPVQLSCFIGGFVTFHLIRTLRESHQAQYQMLSPYITVLLIFTLFAAATSSVNWLRSTLLVVLIWIGLITTIAERKNKWLVNPVMCYLGKISYSVYIIHFAVIDFFKSKVLTVGQNADPSMQLLALYVAVLSASAFVATFTYRYIEQSAIKVGKTFH